MVPTTAENITHRLLHSEDTALFQALVSANETRIREYFPLTVKAVDSRVAPLMVADWLKMQSAGELYVFLLFAEEKDVAGCIILKNIDRMSSKAELAYFADVRHEGKGIISRKLSEIIAYSFGELNLNKLIIRCHPDNTASVKVAMRNGFSKEGLLRAEFRSGSGAVYDLAYYGLLKQEHSGRMTL